MLGRPLIWDSLREAGRLPADLSVPQRFQVQQRFSRRLLRHLQVNLELRGLEHLGQGPYLIASLHEGIADVLCLLQLPLPMRFVARREIFGWPEVGPVDYPAGPPVHQPRAPVGRVS